MENLSSLRQKLTGMLIGIARAADGNDHLVTADTDDLILEALAADENADALSALMTRAEAEKRRMVPNCFTCAAPCGRTADYDLGNLWQEPEDIRREKLLLLSALRELAAQISKLPKGGYGQAGALFRKALFFIGLDGCGLRELQDISSELTTLRGQLPEL